MGVNDKKLKVLISCYACSPNRGSEPGMGWNFVREIAKYHDLNVIVEEEKWAEPISEYLNAHPGELDKVKFHFIRKIRGRTLRKIWPPSYYWFYRNWQKKALELALELDKKENFDLIHQLNMVGFREPGYLWKLEKPLVWGPVGGMGYAPWRYLPHIGLKGFCYYLLHNVFNFLHMNFLIRPQRAAQKAGNTGMIYATPDVRYYAGKLWGVGAGTVITEVGPAQIQGVVRRRDGNESLKIAWSGLHIPRKNLPMLLKALAQLSELNYELHILGDGPENAKWKRLALKLGINDKCRWHGWLDHGKANDLILHCHIAIISSFWDLTSTVTMEFLGAGLPVICLDTCGFAAVVNENCGIKIPLKSYKENVLDFAEAITKLAKDDELRQRLSKGALARAGNFSWENKGKELNEIYQQKGSLK